MNQHTPTNVDEQQDAEPAGLQESGAPPARQPATEPGEDDPASWVDEHGDALFRYAILRVRDTATAEEIVQECFVSALRAWQQFEGRSSTRTWLIGILRRKIVDHYRSQARQISLDAAGGMPANESDSGGDEFFDKAGLWQGKVASWSQQPEASASKEEFWQVMRGCLDNLPPSLAEPFLLREIDELSSEEVCQLLGLTPTNLWTRLHRARLSLRACLQHNWFKSPQRP